jgi:hypothetical protein
MLISHSVGVGMTAWDNADDTPRHCLYIGYRIATPTPSTVSLILGLIS